MRKNHPIKPQRKMTLIGLILFLLCWCVFLSSANADDGDKIILPTGDDEFSRLVRAAEAGDQNINFTSLRTAWLNSPYYQNRLQAASLRKSSMDAVKAKDTASVAKVARQILSINYTDMLAHKYLRQACKLLGNETCEEHHHFIEFGLLKSIVKQGDGSTCKTAWPVVSIDEEYFVLSMSGRKLIRQTLISEQGHHCDKMEVTNEKEGQETVYFNVDSFMGKM